VIQAAGKGFAYGFWMGGASYTVSPYSATQVLVQSHGYGQLISVANAVSAAFLEVEGMQFLALACNTSKSEILRWNAGTSGGFVPFQTIAGAGNGGYSAVAAFVDDSSGASGLVFAKWMTCESDCTIDLSTRSSALVYLFNSANANFKLSQTE